MSQSASQAYAFYKDVAKNKKVWTIRDQGGFPCPMTRTGKRSQPFWSSLSRVEKIIKNVPEYAGFQPVEVSWEEFRDKCLPEIEKDGMLVGVNWSGKNVTGYDLDAAFVKSAVESGINSLYN